MASVPLRKSPVIPAIAVLAVATAATAPVLAPPVVQALHALRSIAQPGSGTHVVCIAAVLFLAGVVSGLAGFAFFAVAACALWLLPPLQAVPLIMLQSACNQLLSIGKLRSEMTIRTTVEREGALPYIIGGLAGAPIGVAVLRGLPSNVLAAGLGLFLIVYSVLMLWMPDRPRIGRSGWQVTGCVGFLGGIVGGFSGFGASVLVVYLSLRGLGKSATRGITQPFILTMQLVSLGVLAVADPGIFNIFFWLLWALTLPVVLLGSATGVALYRRLNDGNFRRAVLILLILSGASLLAKIVI